MNPLHCRHITVTLPSHYRYIAEPAAPRTRACHPTHPRLPPYGCSHPRVAATLGLQPVACSSSSPISLRRRSRVASVRLPPSAAASACAPSRPTALCSSERCCSCLLRASLGRGGNQRAVAGERSVRTAARPRRVSLRTHVQWVGASGPAPQWREVRSRLVRAVRTALHSTAACTSTHARALPQGRRLLGRPAGCRAARSSGAARRPRRANQQGCSLRPRRCRWPQGRGSGVVRRSPADAAPARGPRRPRSPARCPEENRRW